jgi:hypothetical protein
VVDEASMIAPQSKPRPAGLFSALTLFLSVCALFVVLPAAALAAPSGSEEATPELTFEPGSYDFGLQQVNSYNSQASLQLRNSGAVATQVVSTDITGPGSGAFWLGASDCFGRTLNSDETCSVQVNFNPYDAVPFAVQLRASIEGGASFSAELSGEGGRAVIGPESSPTNFGAVAVGSAVTETIDITNSGNFPGGSFIAVIAGGAIGSFHLLDENCTGIPLDPGAFCTLQVSFEPLSTGVKTARLGLFGDSDGGAQVMLTGVGVEPDAAPKPAGSSAGMSGTTSSAPGPRKQQRFRSKPRRGKSLHRLRHRRVATPGLRQGH